MAKIQIEDPKTVKTFPTKELFISMLIKDITLRDAIGDLVDNCIDGARAMNDSVNYKGLAINISVDKNNFEINDNCGGFSVETAREYAFRFGRPVDFKGVKGSVGQFGIGMKRAIFKIGNIITIESTTKKTYFKLVINVDEWRKDINNWNFQFDSFKEKMNNPKSLWGTKIQISKLTKEAQEQFKESKFLIELADELSKENMYNIHNGIEIKLNSVLLKSQNLFLINNDAIKPAYETAKYGAVTVKIHAGIADEKNEKANLRLGGWYIFCNDRLIVGPDQSPNTGWAGKGKDGVASYHGQFSLFRGYVFFYADNAGLLPWNTTKTNVDLDSPVYAAVRQKMISLMRPVITFLNKVKIERENDNPENNQPLNNLIKSSKQEDLTVIQNKPLKSTAFIYPILDVKRTENMSRISYTVHTDKLEAAKKVLRVKGNGDVGLKTFEYFYSNEVE